MMYVPVSPYLYYPSLNSAHPYSIYSLQTNLLIIYVYSIYSQSNYQKLAIVLLDAQNLQPSVCNSIRIFPEFRKPRNEKTCHRGVRSLPSHMPSTLWCTNIELAPGN